MRAHQLDETGLIVNTIMVDALIENMVDADIVGGSIGDTVANGYLMPRSPDAMALPPVPFEVTMLQARLALLSAGLFDAVDAAIEAIPDATQRTRARIQWTSAQNVERSHELTQFMAVALGLSDAELDGLFRAATLL